MVYMCTVLTTDRLIKDVDTLNESELTRVKDCICNVINYKCELETQGNKSSVSNDGLSVSYIQKTNKQVEEELEWIFNTWLGALKKVAGFVFEQTVTVVNKHVDHITKQVSFNKTVLNNCMWKKKTEKTIENSNIKMLDCFL